MSDRVYGIDLGTTYSAVAVLNAAGLPEIVKNFVGEDTTPSVVYFEEDGTVVVGSQAKQTQISDPDNACSLVKRRMGEDFPLEFRGQSHTPESISALILKELVSSANDQSGQNITKTVITVPAYFGTLEREATRQAGEIAGLEVVGVLPEPVAAAITLQDRLEDEQTLLVFDLGGGTFDTTVMQAGSGRVDVVAIDGNRLLGGADWDQRLEDLFIEKFAEQAEVDAGEVSADEEFMTALRVDVENAKAALTLRPATKLFLNYEGQRQQVEVTRAEFEEATSDLVAQTIEITNRAVETARSKLPGLQIDRLLLVGGSSRMPMIEESLRKAGFSPERTDFDLSVAKGAAVFGAGELPAYEFGDAPEGEEAVDSGGGSHRPGIGPAHTVVTNVLSRGIGMEVVRQGPSGQWDERYVMFLAHANETLPLVRSTDVFTVSDNQTSLTTVLYEQLGEVESDDPVNNKALVSGDGTTISGFPPLPRESRIECQLEISEEGIVTLVAVEPESGKSFRAEAAVSVLSQEDVEKAKAQISAIKTMS